MLCCTPPPPLPLRGRSCPLIGEFGCDGLHNRVKGGGLRGPQSLLPTILVGGSE